MVSEDTGIGSVPREGTWDRKFDRSDCTRDDCFVRTTRGEGCAVES